MDLQSPCSACTSLHRKPPLVRRLSSLNSVNFPLNSVKCRWKTTPKVQTPVAVAVSGQNGSSYSPSVPTHKVTVLDRQRGVVHEFLVPEDQYILHTAEAQNITLPFACRHGCCTSCAVRVKSGELRQPEALGISAELKSKTFMRSDGRHTLLNPMSQSIGSDHDDLYQLVKGYALLCVGFPSSDLEVETQDEDEVYWLQFGRYFARGPIERDDYALELAMGDE
ncbi:hypothetical protein MTR67_036786 [Solanum verrucosum]|uniref:2Fe-2S ferredoxin-type domain-containing protein n=1 Tax=Solanum verrucosum TaxID=315347 RepID=A0AAF0UD07_SOLVR|nr:hypothetical protein MTR67_036786 [Solanum verrucosum]